MEYGLSQLALVQKSLSKKYKRQIPIVYAGDIFDKWNSPPELINFALKHLPFGYAIPGQHDLPFHSLENIHKSAYWTLCETSHIHNLEEDKPYDLGYNEDIGKSVWLHAFPWKTDITPNIKRSKGINVAVVHKYIWSSGVTSYHDAPEENRVDVIGANLKGYHAAFFGDNHIGFTARNMGKDGDWSLMNCGGFFQTKSDQVDYKPQIGILYQNKEGGIYIYRQELHTNAKWVERPAEAEKVAEFDSEEFLKELAALGDKAIDFARVLRRRAGDKGISEDVKTLLLRSLGEDK